MSWNRTCCMSSTTSSTDSGSSSRFSPLSATRHYDIQPPPPAPPLPPPGSASSSSFFFFQSPDYIEEQSNRERDENNSIPPNSSVPYNYHPHVYSPVFASRAITSDPCVCNTPNTQVPSYDISSSFQTPFVYEQYITSLKSEQSDHLPYLFDNIIYPQPCSPPSPPTDSITYYQLDQANTTTIINKFPQRSHIPTIQPITYHQLSLVEPPSSNIQQKLPIVKRFYYDSNHSNTTTITIMTTTSIVTNTNENDHVQLPYARLDSTYFGTYDIWQERTLVGRKNSRREVDVNIGSTSVVSRVHFEILLINENEFHLKCLSKNGLFINNNYTKMSATTVLPKQCILRFPSTDLCISFSSLLNNNSNLIHQTSPSTDTSQRNLSLASPINPTPSISLQSVPTIKSEQQVIIVNDNHQTQGMIKHENFPPLNIHIPPKSSSSSFSSNDSSFSISSNTEQGKCQQDSPTIKQNSFLGSSCSTSSKTDSNDSQPAVNSPNIQRFRTIVDDHIPQEHDNHFRNGTKPPFSYAQLIVQAILSTPDKQMTLSQIYNFISAQYPYYEANNRGWQNSIRHNLSLNRYFIRLARKENESGKGSFWRLDQTCEEKLIDHAFRHRKHRANFNQISIHSNIKHECEETHSPMIHYSNDHTDFLLADIPASNCSTPVTSPLSPYRQNEDSKRKYHMMINGEIEDLVNSLLDLIDNERTVKRQKI